MKRNASEARRSGPGVYEGRLLPHPDEPVFDQGLGFDLGTLLDRRRMLRLMGVAGVGAGLLLVGCRPDGESTTPASTGGGPTTAGAGEDADCAAVPEETAGPYPGDGSNGADVLGQSGVVRSDIRSSFGELSGTAEGTPLTIRLAIQDADNGCAPMAGAAVYVWHCDREGRYSLYTVTDQNYLRGVQAAGDDGVATFTSVFPGCYAGRWPHVHFEVFPSLDASIDDANKVATSQIALPEATCRAVYGTSGYEQSVVNLGQVSLQTDNVFGDDGGARQLGRVTGMVDDGLTVDLTVPVNAA